ncbi:MAG: hypothetical protein K2I56_06080, partial [Muribaculaceae bacterium]|nr:hypothetical protein [Muribaculaceae bacterium]
GHSLALFSILLSHSAKALLVRRMKKITQRLTALALTFIAEPALNSDDILTYVRSDTFDFFVILRKILCICGLF